MDNNLVKSGWSMLDDSSHLFESLETIFQDGVEESCDVNGSVNEVLERLKKEEEVCSYLWADLRLSNMELLRGMEEAKSQIHFLKEMLSNVKDEVKTLAKESGLQHMVVTGFGHLDHMSKIIQHK